jgi:WD40 repeat protein
LHGHANEVWCAAFSADGQMLVTGGKDQNVLLWQPELNLQRTTIPFESQCQPIFSPTDSKLLCLQHDSNYTAVLWNPQTLTSVATFFAVGPRVVGYSPDGREVAFINENQDALDFWPPAAKAPSHRVQLSNLPAGIGEFLKWGMSPAMDYFFALDKTGIVRIWKTDTGILVRAIQVPKPPIRNLALSAQAAWLAVSVENDNEVHLFDCATGRETHLTGHKDFVSGLNFSSDGTALATGSVDGTIRLWQVATGTQTALLPGHMQETTDVAFSPDGNTLASLSQGESLKLWHIPTLREVYSEDLPQAGTWLRFSPDGLRLAVGTRENQIRFLQAPKE